MNSTHNDFNHIEFIVISYKLYPAKKRKRLNISAFGAVAILGQMN